VTGVAGLTLGGGIGWLMRRHGLTCDNLVAADVVTAEGELVRAGEDGEAELLWGLRGGGGNFGIVVSFEFRLHEVGPDVAAGVVFYSAEQAREVLGGYADFAATAPDDVTTIVSLRRVPDLPASQRRFVAGRSSASQPATAGRRWRERGFSSRCATSARRCSMRSTSSRSSPSRRSSTPPCRPAGATTGVRSTSDP
jgi:FAD/FMN-containing dehydrogenase